MKTKSILTTVACAGALTLLSGCASVLCGPKQSIAIDSRPAGAEVVVYDAAGEIVFAETTPCVASLKRSNADYERASYVVLIRKEGFDPVQVPLTGKLNRAYLGNLLAGGIGLVIDPVTGSMWTLTPSDLEASLLEQNAAFFSHKKGLLVCLKEQVPKELAAHLQPLSE